MPIPLIAAAGAKLGGALTALKGGLGAAKGFAAKRMAGQKLGSMLGGPKQLSLDLGAAGKAGLNMTDGASRLERIKRGLTSLDGFKKNLGVPLTKQDIAMTVAPDLLFGGITAATTEGDIGDKLIAGTGSAIGGIAGGVGLRGALGPKSGLGILGTEMIGGMIGDQLGYGAAENLIRMKGGGMTPMEKKQAEADALYKQQLMAELGLM